MANGNRLSILSCTIGVAIVVFVSNNAGSSAGQSLKDMARANGGKITTTLTVNMPFGSLARVTEVADVVIHGRIVATEARLSKDETYISTYVSLTPFQFLKGSIRPAISPKPGFTSGIVFVHGGGKVVSEGLEMTFENEVAPEPPLRVGEEVIAFLATKEDEPGVLMLPYSSHSLLRVQGNRVANSNKQTAKTRPLDSYNLADVQRTVRELVAKSKR